ncbi:MAG: hypothetical protein AB7E42_05280 [Anaerotignaceae bacterium]
MNKVKSKKLVSLVLSMAMVLSVMPQMAINVEAASLPDVASDGSELTPYIIDEADDLVWLAEQVNAGTMGTSKHFMQINDIDLSGYTWTPIGSDTSPFIGTFDGDGHIISGYTAGTYTDSNMGECSGLFGNIGTDGTVTKLGVNGANTSAKYVGGIAACNY